MVSGAMAISHPHIWEATMASEANETKADVWGNWGNHAPRTGQLWAPPQAPYGSQPGGRSPKRRRHWLRWIMSGIVVLIVIIVIATNSSHKTNTTAGSTATKPLPTAKAPTSHTGAAVTPHAAPAPVAPEPTPVRQVMGTAATLGAGNFTAGTDVQPGLYDVTTGVGQSGNFIVQGTDSYDEILGVDSTVPDMGLPRVRVKISSGDTIQISGLSSVTFTPVTTPLTTTHSLVNLYAGTWTVGQDLGSGRYVATPGAGQSGNFIVESEGVDEILGTDPSVPGMGVPNVTITLHKGDVITISSLSQVTMTPA
jgi:hypothetical protein